MRLEIGITGEFHTVYHRMSAVWWLRQGMATRIELRAGVEVLRKGDVDLKEGIRDRSKKAREMEARIVFLHIRFLAE
jgi:hypothetical protein